MMADEREARAMKITIFFAWYDFWIGWYYDQKKATLYVCPLPMCAIKIEKLR
jgi:hypothetical protein